MPPLQDSPYTGISEYLHAVGDVGTEADALAEARTQPALDSASNLFANAAEQIRRNDPAGLTAALRTLEAVDVRLRALELAHAAGVRARDELKGKVQALAKEGKYKMAKNDQGQDEVRPGSDIARDPAATVPGGAGPVPADKSGKPLDLSVPPEQNANPELSDVGRLKEGKETLKQTETENAEVRTGEPGPADEQGNALTPEEKDAGDRDKDKGGLFGRTPKGGKGGK